MKTLKERIAIEQHHLDSGPVEFIELATTSGWFDVFTDSEHVFDWIHNDYRIKKEPRVIWLVGRKEAGFFKVFEDEHKANELVAAFLCDGIIVSMIKTIEVIE